MWQHIVNPKLLSKCCLMFSLENYFRKPGFELTLGSFGRDLDFPPAAGGKSLEAGQQKGWSQVSGSGSVAATNRPGFSSVWIESCQLQSSGTGLSVPSAKSLPPALNTEVETRYYL